MFCLNPCSSSAPIAVDDDDGICNEDVLVVDDEAKDCEILPNLTKVEEDKYSPDRNWVYCGEREELEEKMCESTAAPASESSNSRDAVEQVDEFFLSSEDSENVSNVVQCLLQKTVKNKEKAFENKEKLFEKEIKMRDDCMVELKSEIKTKDFCLAKLKSEMKTKDAVIFRQTRRIMDLRNLLRSESQSVAHARAELAVLKRETSFMRKNLFTAEQAVAFTHGLHDRYKKELEKRLSRGYAFPVGENPAASAVRQYIGGKNIKGVYSDLRYPRADPPRYPRADPPRYVSPKPSHASFDPPADYCHRYGSLETSFRYQEPADPACYVVSSESSSRYQEVSDTPPRCPQVADPPPYESSSAKSVSEPCLSSETYAPAADSPGVRCESSRYPAPPASSRLLHW